MAQLLFLLVTFGLMWFVLVRPQQQRVRRQQELVASLQVGDEVITAGGMIGRIVGLDEDEARIEVAPGTEVRFVRLAVNARVGDDATTGLPAGAADDPGAAESVDGGSR